MHVTPSGASGSLYNKHLISSYIPAPSISVGSRWPSEFNQSDRNHCQPLWGSSKDPLEMISMIEHFGMQTETLANESTTTQTHRAMELGTHLI